MPVDWFKNEKLFQRECETGHKWERYVAKSFREEGLAVELPKQEFRDHVREAPEYSDDPDIYIEDRLFEIKSRRLFFHHPSNFPYETVLVDTVSGWEAKDTKPVGIICVSQFTGAIIVLASKTQPRWTIERRYDNVREIEVDFYEAPRDFWAPASALISRLFSLRETGDENS